MGDALRKEDVLTRQELDMNDSIDVKHFRTEGEHPNNQFWHGEKCYIPVIYKAKPYKLRVRVKSPLDKQ